MRSFAPFAFILIWSTGFLVGRGAMPHADPYLFLGLRFALVAAVFAIAAGVARAAWPTGGRSIGTHLLAGALMSGFYLGPSWWAMEHGLPAGVLALLGALQPLFTALIAVAVLRQRLAPRTWGGLAVGFTGVALVILPRLLATGAGALPVPVVLVAVASILSLTIGAMVQKTPSAAGDIRCVSALQNLGAVAVVLAMAAAFGSGRWDHSLTLWACLAWATVGLSLGATTLLIRLMRSGEATRTAALLLAVPPLAAVQGWLIFGETLSAVQLLGFVLAIGGVALARR
ncbi:DMT family transporter [Xylophilus sp.]|uniref:DMT family transporter n=1 Tax=Xylophilus sp. TaxID=2653893 RepID=UPI0013BE5DCC|nr:DMT family transporter [Xylophilus sp.]KAF1049293.1 MAG: hypothetical protein GAK38_00748 [Xylophilus sp.]